MVDPVTVTPVDSGELEKIKNSKDPKIQQVAKDVQALLESEYDKPLTPERLKQISEATKASGKGGRQ